MTHLDKIDAAFEPQIREKLLHMKIPHQIDEIVEQQIRDGKLQVMNGKAETPFHILSACSFEQGAVLRAIQTHLRHHPTGHRSHCDVVSTLANLLAQALNCLDGRASIGHFNHALHAAGLGMVGEAKPVICRDRGMTLEEAFGLRPSETNIAMVLQAAPSHPTSPYAARSILKPDQEPPKAADQGPGVVVMEEIP